MKPDDLMGLEEELLSSYNGHLEDPLLHFGLDFFIDALDYLILFRQVRLELKGVVAIIRNNKDQTDLVGIWEMVEDFEEGLLLDRMVKRDRHLESEDHVADHGD